MTSKRTFRCVAKSTLPPTALSASPNVGVRACGCAHRFLPTLPLHSHSAPVLARRRSRSSTGSSSKSARSMSSGRNTPSPSPVHPSSLKQKAMSESHLADITDPPLPSKNRIEESDTSEPQPILFSTSVLIRISPNKPHFLEQVKYEVPWLSVHKHKYSRLIAPRISYAGMSGETLHHTRNTMRYGPAPTQDELVSPLSQSQQFRTELEIQVDNPSVVESTSNQT